MTDILVCILSPVLSWKLSVNQSRSNDLNWLNAWIPLLQGIHFRVVVYSMTLKGDILLDSPVAWVGAPFWLRVFTSQLRLNLPKSVIKTDQNRTSWIGSNFVCVFFLTKPEPNKPKQERVGSDLVNRVNFKTLFWKLTNQKVKKGKMSLAQTQRKKKKCRRHQMGLSLTR